MQSDHRDSIAYMRISVDTDYGASANGARVFL